MSSVQEHVVNLMRCAERLGVPAARFFASGISREQQAEICAKCGVSLTEETADFFEVINGLNAPPDAKIADLALVISYAPLDLSKACERFSLVVDPGAMPKEYFPIFRDFSDGFICVVQRNSDSFTEGAVVFWSAEENVVGAFKSLQDFLKYAAISLEQCSLQEGGIDFNCTVVNANKFSRMVDPEAKVFWDEP